MDQFVNQVRRTATCLAASIASSGLPSAMFYGLNTGAHHSDRPIDVHECAWPENHRAGVAHRRQGCFAPSTPMTRLSVRGLSFMGDEEEVPMRNPYSMAKPDCKGRKRRDACRDGRSPRRPGSEASRGCIGRGDRPANVSCRWIPMPFWSP